MMRTKGPVIFVCLLLALLWAMPAVAQEQSGAIEGVVKDSSGAVLPGVTVEAKNLTTSALVTAVTDAQGVYRFPALAPGTYEITAKLQGFGDKKLSGNLALGQLLKVEITMAVAGVAETVQVTGEAPLIDTKQNATFATVSQEIIDRIPKGRNFTDVIAMAAGANNEDRAGGISIAGASGSENRFIVDGVDTTNLQNGSSGKSVVYDFIQEVQVKTSGYNAEYPGATGGVVNAVSKSGSNVFKGSAGFYYTNNDSFKGPVRPGIRLNPTKTTEVQYTHTQPAVVPDWQPVFEIGGPVLKDRIFFYVGYAPERTSTSRTVTFKAAPADGSSLTKTYKQDNPNDMLYGSVNAQLSNSLRVKFSFAPTWYRSRGSVPGVNPYEVSKSPFDGYAAYDSRSDSNPDTDYKGTGSNSWNNAYSGLVDYLVTPTWYLNFAGGYFMTNSEGLGAGTEIVRTMQDNISIYASDPTYNPAYYQPSGYSDNKSSYTNVRDKFTRLYLNATSTWYANAKGQHAIKAGLRFERFGEDRYQGQVQPTLTFNWGSAYNRTGGGQVMGKYGYLAVSKGVVGVGDIHSNNWGLFAQDSWSPKSNLTINAGVRVESEKIPFYTLGETGGIEFGFGDKIAPRVGFAYDLKGDSKWKLYGSYGRFFDIMKLEMPRGSLGGESWLIYYYPLNTLNWASVSCQEGDATCAGGAVDSEVSKLRFGSNEANNPDTMEITTKYFGKPRNMIQEDMKPMGTQEFTFGLDHELNKSSSMGIRYVHNNVGRAIEDFGWNEGGTEYYFIGNPGYGSIGELGVLWDLPGNPCVATNTCLYHTANAGGFHPQVKPVRKYDALELSWTKRLANRWAAQATYTYSRLFGNYPGLASSDEAGSGTARLSPNVNRLYDGIWMMYDTKGQQVLGRLNNDRPHYLKLQGSYDFKWGTTVGMQWYVRSGALFSKYVTYQGYSWIFYDGRGNMGRSPLEQMASLYLAQDIPIGKRMHLNLNLNVSNLFDNSQSISLYALQYRDSFQLSSIGKPIESFFIPWDPNAVAAQYQAAGKTMRPDPRYGLDNIFLGRRDIRVGAKFTF